MGMLEDSISFFRGIDTTGANGTITLLSFPVGDILLCVDSHPMNEYRGKPTPVKCSLGLGDNDTTRSFR